jgi:signal transduction histidine kinase
LREVKVFATDILASMDQGVITTDQSGFVTSINPCGQSLLGGASHSNLKWIGCDLKQIDDRFAPLDEICRHVLMHDDVVWDRDCVVEIDGHRRTLRCGCTPLRDSKFRKLGAVLQIRDVTEQILIQERMLRMERHMELGTLAAGLQHEIKNPLSALSLHVQLLGEHLSGKYATPEIMETLSVLRIEMARITDVLRGFRTYADISEPGRSKVDVAGLVTKLVRLITLQAERQSVKLRLDLPAHPLVPVELDSNRFEQVLLNLAVNALQAMPCGGTLSIRLRQSEEEMRLEVSDTGKGIPTDIQKRVFDPYFTTQPGGTGLGLALCEKIVRQHSGSIDLQSSPAGTTFTISIPLECPV